LDTKEVRLRGLFVAGSDKFHAENAAISKLVRTSTFLSRAWLTRERGMIYAFSCPVKVRKTPFAPRIVDFKRFKARTENPNLSLQVPQRII
jgi:hypothetical protein